MRYKQDVYEVKLDVLKQIHGSDEALPQAVPHPLPFAFPCSSQHSSELRLFHHIASTIARYGTDDCERPKLRSRRMLVEPFLTLSLITATLSGLGNRFMGY